MQFITRHEASRHQYQATGGERLAALATFLDSLRPGRLTLGLWFGNGRGCAVGLAAATEPWFQAQGLRLKGVERPSLCHPVYRESSDWEAVAEFFGLTVAEAYELFSAAAYGGNLQPAPRTVADRIRQHLAARDPADAAVCAPVPA